MKSHAMYTRIPILMVLVGLLTGGCVAYYSAHKQFTGSMDTYASVGRTIDAYNDPSVSHYRPAAIEHLTSIEHLDGEVDRYHFRRPRFKYFCHYYFDVDRETRLVIGWGFDEHLADPRKTCGMSG